MFTSIKTAITAAAALAMVIVPATAEFTSACSEICFKEPNLLVTKCTVDGTSQGVTSMWSQFNLDQILYYNSGLPGLQYQQYGDAIEDGCNQCSMSGSVITCRCGSLDLNTYMTDVTGRLCFANNEFGPICSADTSLTC